MIAEHPLRLDPIALKTLRETIKAEQRRILLKGQANPHLLPSASELERVARLESYITAIENTLLEADMEP